MNPTSRQELHNRAADTYAGLALPGAGEAAERIAGHLLGAGRTEAVGGSTSGAAPTRS